jgi:hypothetical protein
VDLSFYYNRQKISRIAEVYIICLEEEEGSYELSHTKLLLYTLYVDKH